MAYINIQPGVCSQVCTKFTLLISMALDETRAVLKILFATTPHALGFHAEVGHFPLCSIFFLSIIMNF